MKQEILNAIEEYKQGKLSLAKVAGKHQIDRTHLSNILKRLGIQIINRQNLPRVNETVFDKIDTEEKAYWLGFMFADGFILSTDNTIGLDLAEKDFSHLEKYKRFLEFTGELKISNTNFPNSKRVRLEFGSKYMKQILIQYGCTPKKSLTLKFPDINIFSNKELVKHFIRGYVDGDGCLTFQNKEHTIPALDILGTEEFLTELSKHIPIKCTVSKCYNKRLFHINFTRRRAYELTKYIYKDSTVYLDRKKNKYEEYCRLYE